MILKHLLTNTRKVSKNQYPPSTNKGVNKKRRWKIKIHTHSSQNYEAERKILVRGTKSSQVSTRSILERIAIELIIYTTILFWRKYCLASFTDKAVWAKELYNFAMVSVEMRERQWIQTHTLWALQAQALSRCNNPQTDNFRLGSAFFGSFLTEFQCNQFLFSQNFIFRRNMFHLLHSEP